MSPSRPFLPVWSSGWASSCQAWPAQPRSSVSLTWRDHGILRSHWSWRVPSASVQVAVRTTPYDVLLRLSIRMPTDRHIDRRLVGGGLLASAGASPAFCPGPRSWRHGRSQGARLRRRRADRRPAFSVPGETFQGVLRCVKLRVTQSELGRQAVHWQLTPNNFKPSRQAPPSIRRTGIFVRICRPPSPARPTAMSTDLCREIQDPLLDFSCVDGRGLQRQRSRIPESSGRP